MAAASPSITSFDILPASEAAPSAVRLRENFFPADAFHYGGGFGLGFAGPHGYRRMPWWSATGTAQDRKGGRDLPTYWNEIDLRGFRLVARDLDARNPYAIGFLDLLTAYHVRKGYGWQACLKGAEKTPYPTPRTQDPTVKKAQRILDAWRDANQWGLLSQEAFRRWRRDGEVFGRFFFGGWDRLPAFRFIDPERVGSPTGDTDGPDSFGVRTDPDDVCEHVAYHVWDAREPATVGEWVDADKVVFAKCNTDTGVKRGVTDFLPTSEDLGWVRQILQSMLASTQRVASKAWVEKFPGSTADQVRALVPEVPGRVTPAFLNPADPFYGYRGYGYDPNWLEPAGSIMRTEGDREFMPVPGADPGGYIAVMQAALRATGTRYGMPEFFSGDASNQNMASSLVSHAPFVVATEVRQHKYGQVWERPVALKVLDLACEAGILTRAERARLDVEVTEPQVASAEPDKDASTDQIYHAMGVKSATTIQLARGLDPQHEQANFDAERKRGMVPGDEPPPEGGGGGNPFAGVFGESVLWEAGFTGTLRGKDGREYHYADGKRVAAGDESGGDAAKAAGPGFGRLETGPEGLPGKAARSAGAKISTALAKLKRGEISPQDAKRAAAEAAEAAAAEMRDQSRRRMAVLRADVARVHGEDAVESPEWAQVEYYAQMWTDEAADHVGSMAEVAAEAADHFDAHDEFPRNAKSDFGDFADAARRAGHNLIKALADRMAELKKKFPAMAAGPKDASGHEHAADGKFGKGPGKRGDAAELVAAGKPPFPVDLDPPYHGRITDADVEAAPAARVRLADLVATQSHLNADHARALAAAPAGAGKFAVVVRTPDGKLYLDDGTHHAAAAALRGETHVAAKVFDFDGTRLVAAKESRVRESKDASGHEHDDPDRAGG